MLEHPLNSRQLTTSLQVLARDLELPPLLIAADQEGGQLMAIGDGTQLPGNMATRCNTFQATWHVKPEKFWAGSWLHLGINVNYAPCADVNINPLNPVVGVRSFGEDPLSGRGSDRRHHPGDPIPGCCSHGQAFPRARGYGQRLAPRACDRSLTALIGYAQSN